MPWKEIKILLSQNNTMLPRFLYLKHKADKTMRMWLRIKGGDTMIKPNEELQRSEVKELALHIVHPSSLPCNIYDYMIIWFPEIQQ